MLTEQNGEEKNVEKTEEKTVKKNVQTEAAGGETPVTEKEWKELPLDDMSLTVYRQAAKDLNGVMNYRGEDARPFVTRGMLLVADGLGGASAIRHTKMDRDMFDEEKICDVLFSKAYEDYGDEQFKDYVKSSFRELSYFKDDIDGYLTNTRLLKKGGYFGSRIVSSIILHELIYDKDGKFTDGKIFEGYEKAATPEEKEAFLKDTGKYFAEVIKQKLKAVSESANLIYESSYSGLALLATTLCATFYRETADGVETICLMSGDSRPYVIDGDGMAQVIEDQEGADGGMTNYIQATEGKDFDVLCKYKKFEKPCILFNCSDGVFDSGYFLSQMALEKLLLEDVASSENMRDAGKLIESKFEELGRHDDSSTIALRAFGFENYAAVRAFAKKRLKDIDEKFLVPFDGVYTEQFGANEEKKGLLDKDFTEAAEDTRAAFSDRREQLKAKIAEDGAVVEYVKKELIAHPNDCPEYERKIKEIDEKVEERNKQIESLEKEILEVVELDFLTFAKKYKQDYYDADAMNKAQKEKRRYETLRDSFKNGVITNRESVKRLGAEFESMFDQLEKIELKGENSFDGFNFSSLDDLSRKIKEVWSYVMGFEGTAKGSMKNIEVIKANYCDINYKKNKQIKKYPSAAVEVMRSLLKDEKETVEEWELFDGSAEKLGTVLPEVRSLIGARDTNDVELRARAVEDCVPAYWAESKIADEVLEKIALGEITIADADVAQEIRAYCQELNQSGAKILKCADKQKELFELYDKNYLKYIGD